MINIISISLQIAASILLAQMVVFRKKREIESLAKITLPIGGKFPGIKRILFETWLSRFGFCYLIFGFIFQFFKEKYLNIGRFSEINITIILVVLFWLFGWILSKYLSKKQYPEIEKRCKENRADGEMWIQP
jgi:uncharacterized membrane protein (DUF485 family)